jgi:hypothetical protein
VTQFKQVLVKPVLGATLPGIADECRRDVWSLIKPVGMV